MTLRTFAFAAVLCLAGVGSASAQAPAAADAALAKVIAGPQRTAVNTARDAARHPAETLTFWGLRPGAVVIELNPGGGYWTEILAPYAAQTGGHYVTTGADLADASVSQAAKDGRAKFAARFADRAVWGDVAIVDFGAKSGPLGPPGSADMVITARNIHNWLGPRLDKVMADSFAVLKPGGVLAVEEHRSDPRPMKEGQTDGYVSEAFAIAEAKKAGFVFDGRSDVNANPKDTKDHPFGVWTLPPTRRSSADAKTPAAPDLDPAKYDAIGESDRMTLRFRKPR